jgi:L-ascorbate metabolism protein UlaG (beta-lactamase superfamily)
LTALSITRVVNACVLLELGEAAVLTDPYFQAHWFMRMHEPVGLEVALPLQGGNAGAGRDHG